MSYPTFEAWLNRKSAGPRPRKPLPKVTKKRAKQNRQYSADKSVFLFLNPICAVWLEQQGWEKSAPGEYKHKHEKGWSINGWKWATADALLFAGAEKSEVLHHRNKRRGARLLDQTHWMAVSNANHERIEQNKSWARANGFLLNF